MTTPPTNPPGETPRTDKAWDDEHPLTRLSDGEKRDFARQLERELAAVTKERDELAQDNRMLEHNCYMGEDDEKRDLRARLTLAEADGERLAGALEMIAQGTQLTHDVPINRLPESSCEIIRAAIAAHRARKEKS